MFIYIILAIINGITIGISRSINGRLSIDIGPFRASFWNHIVGFLFLVTALILLGGFRSINVVDIPVFTYLGGFFGALFVAVNSYVFTRLGASKTILLVISGQMITSVLIEYKGGDVVSTLMQLMGVVIILFGVYLAKTSQVCIDKSNNIVISNNVPLLYITSNEK